MSSKRNIVYPFLVIFMLFISCVLPAKNSQKKITINSINVLTSVTESNCIYVVSGIVDLKGKTIDMPSNCVLDFGKGAIINGIFNGNGTQLIALHKKCIGVRFKGTWVAPKIDDVYFDSDFLTDDQIISSVNFLQNDDIYNSIILRKDSYNCSINSGGYLLKLTSNTKLALNTTITIEGNNYEGYNIIRIKDKKNIEITGGILIGDVGNHNYVDGSSSQWGHGLYIHNSEDIKVNNMIVMKCIGDGFTVTGGSALYYGDMSQASRNVEIENVVARYNRRQGISIIHAENVTVKNSVFSDTGTIESHSPSAGIDIEPNLDPFFQATRYIRVYNCFFERNVGASILSNHYESSDSTMSVSSVEFVNCFCDGRVELHTGGMIFRRTKMSSFELCAERNLIEDVKLISCKISENGIKLNCVNRKKGSYTGIRNLRFDKCDINILNHNWEANNRNPVAYGGNKENIEDVIFRNCNIYIIDK